MRTTGISGAGAVREGPSILSEKDAEARKIGEGSRLNAPNGQRRERERE
jgi:hypothetical protein